MRTIDPREGDAKKAEVAQILGVNPEELDRRLHLTEEEATPREGCPEFRRLEAYLEGNGTDAEKGHIPDCPRCKKIIDTRIPSGDKILALPVPEDAPTSGSTVSKAIPVALLVLCVLGASFLFTPALDFFHQGSDLSLAEMERESARQESLAVKDKFREIEEAYCEILKHYSAAGHPLTSPYGPGTLDTGLQRGMIYLREKKYDAARKEFSAVLEIDGNSLPAHALMVELGQRSGQASLVIPHLKEAKRVLGSISKEAIQEP